MHARRAALSIFDHELKNSASVLTNAVGCNVFDVACCRNSVHFESSRPVTNLSTLSGDGVSLAGGGVVAVAVAVGNVVALPPEALATDGFVDPVAVDFEAPADLAFVDDECSEFCPACDDDDACDGCSTTTPCVSIATPPLAPPAGSTFLSSR